MVPLRPRVDYENAEEQTMRPEVQRQPLLPIYEAVHNAIHASQELELPHIVVDVEIHRAADALVDEVGRIEGFTVTDRGIGFTDGKTEAFFELFTRNKKDTFNCKGMGRLAYFSSFVDVDVNSVFQENGEFRERNFSVTIATIGTDALPKPEASTFSESKTVVKVHGLKPECYKIYSIHSDSVVNSMRDYFAAAVLSLESLVLNIIDGDRTSVIDKKSYASAKGSDITIDNETFKTFHIKDMRTTKGSHEIHLTAAGRVVKKKSIQFLSGHKIGSKDEDRFYLKTIVISDFLDRVVNSTRSQFNGVAEKDEYANTISLEKIFANVSSEIRQYIATIMPESMTANDEMIKLVVDELPHLAAVSDEQSIRNEIPLYSSRDSVRSTLVQEYAKKQLETLNYVMGKAQEYEKKGPPSFDEFLRNESEKLKEGSRLNHAHLTTYVKYREFIIDLFSQFLKKNEDGKYSPEAVLHNLIFPMKTASDNAEADYHKHNLWLIDDRYASYDHLFSDKYEGTVADKKCEPTDKRYDIIAIYEDPAGGAAQNVFIIELKQTHKQLAENNDPVQQLKNYVLRIQDNKLNKEDGGRINITDTTSYHGVVLCDIHCDYFKKNMIRDHSLKKRSDGKSYFAPFLNDTLFIEVTNYENMLELARLRNKAFMDKLKGQ